MLKLKFPLFFTTSSFAIPCENLDIEFPKGIENPASGINLGLSNIAFDDQFLYTGGQFDSSEVY